jgi:hypothetical protein
MQLGRSMAPVSFHVEHPAQSLRLHVLIRLLLLIALGALGCSSLYWLLYLTLPALVALVITQRGGERYLSDDAPAITRVLRVLAETYAYLWLLTDVFPFSERPTGVHFEVTPSGSPTAPSALFRLITSLPALLLLALLSLVSGLLWFFGALFILVAARLPVWIADFLEMTLRYQFRLVAYHLSVVAQYPSLATEMPVAATSV